MYIFFKKKGGRTKSPDPRLKEQIMGKIKSFCLSPTCITLVLKEGVDRRNLFRILCLVNIRQCRNISEKWKKSVNLLLKTSKPLAWLEMPKGPGLCKREESLLFLIFLVLFKENPQGWMITSILLLKETCSPQNTSPNALSCIFYHEPKYGLRTLITGGKFWLKGYHTSCRWFKSTVLVGSNSKVL